MCVFVCLCDRGVCIILVCGGFVSVSGGVCSSRRCVSSSPLLPGFTTFCMRRLTTSPSNHILLSGHRRQQQQVVRPIGIRQSGKIKGERDERMNVGEEVNGTDWIMGA